MQMQSERPLSFSKFQYRGEKAGMVILSANPETFPGVLPLRTGKTSAHSSANPRFFVRRSLAAAGTPFAFFYSASRNTPGG